MTAIENQHKMNITIIHVVGNNFLLITKISGQKYAKKQYFHSSNVSLPKILINYKGEKQQLDSGDTRQTQSELSDQS